MAFRRALPYCLILGSFHCGSDETDVAEPITELTLVSFNAALGVGLAPYAEQRLAALERSLPELDADVICLQEVWVPADIERLTANLASLYPHALRSVRAAGADGATCTESEAALLSTCLADNCAGVEREGLAICAVSSCAGPFAQVSMGCQQCIAANQATMDVENLTTLCGPAGEGSAAAYVDQSGLLLLSRYPLEDLGYFRLDSSLGDRGVLTARLLTTFMGPVDLHCTHLAASLSDVPYTGPYGSWPGERLRQIDQLLERTAETRVASGSTLLLGDMNCGPSTPLAEAASPDAFARFVEAGFSAPYAEGDGRCTFCDNNPLNGLVSDPDEGALIDHVLVSSEGAEATASERVLDEVISVETDTGPIGVAHSDHYGVRVQLSAASAP